LFLKEQWDMQRHMFWKQQMMTEKMMLTGSLFLIGALHTMIFAIFQFPTNFLLGSAAKDLGVYSKLVLYVCAILASLMHQALCRSLGLKKTLIAGLFLNLFGLATLWLNQRIGGTVFLVFIDMIFFGIALTSVINALITFIILKFPHRIGAGIIALFAVFNGGSMLAPLLMGMFKGLNLSEAIFPFLMILIIIAIWHLERSLTDPVYPAHLRHLRKGSLVWKELHVRLGLFLAAMIGYGVTESSFNLWGFVVVEEHLGIQIASETISLFWLFLIIGQVLLLIPLYLYSAQKVLYPLIALVIADLYFFFHQSQLFGFIAGLALGGIGCSAVFPILISMMQGELRMIVKGERILPFIETSVSVMLAGYFIGVGIIDLWIELFKNLEIPLHANYWIAIGCITLTGLIAWGLHLTAPAHRSQDC